MSEFADASPQRSIPAGPMDLVDMLMMGGRNHYLVLQFQKLDPISMTEPSLVYAI